MTTEKDKIDLMDESDRGAVIVGADILSNCLEEVLSRTFKKNNIPLKIYNEMYNSNGPLANFSSKISICYSFGIIKRETYDDLHKIRKIRNNLSHSFTVFNFNSADIGQKIENLNVYEEANKLTKINKRYSLTTHEDDIKKDSHTDSKPEKTNEDFPYWFARSRGLVSYNKSLFCICLILIERDIYESFIAYNRAN